MTLRDAVVSIIPALFSALHVYLPTSLRVTVNTLREKLTLREAASYPPLPPSKFGNA